MLGVAASNLTAHASIIVSSKGAASAIEVARAVMDARTPEAAKAWEDVLDPVKKKLSGDPLDAKLYADAGIDPNKPILLAFGEDSEAAAVIPLADASKWRAFLENDMGEALDYLQAYPESALAINVKACNYFRLYDGKAAESEMKILADKQSGTFFDNELVKHNIVVFR